MSEQEKLIAELATRLLVARINNHGFLKDPAIAYQCRKLATVLVKGTDA